MDKLGFNVYHIELMTVPEDDDDNDKPIEGKSYWVKMDDITHDDIVPSQMFDDLLEAVDAKCKVEHAERRRLATAMKSAIKPSSRRKH